jgi:hypothetical protein
MEPIPGQTVMIFLGGTSDELGSGVAVAMRNGSAGENSTA